jgi:Flp pilus assembly protein TadB
LKTNWNAMTTTTAMETSTMAQHVSEERVGRTCRKNVSEERVIQRVIQRVVVVVVAVVVVVGVVAVAVVVVAVVVVVIWIPRKTERTRSLERRTRCGGHMDEHWTAWRQV